MKIDQTVENHDDLLKVIDILLSKAGLNWQGLRVKKQLPEPIALVLSSSYPEWLLR